MRQITHCYNCDKWFEYDDERQVSCCVWHGRGECCHYGQREVEEPSPSFK